MQQQVSCMLSKSSEGLQKLTQVGIGLPAHVARPSGRHAHWLSKRRQHPCGQQLYIAVELRAVKSCEWSVYKSYKIYHVYQFSHAVHRVTVVLVAV